MLQCWSDSSSLWKHVAVSWCPLKVRKLVSCFPSGTITLARCRTFGRRGLPGSPEVTGGTLERNHGSWTWHSGGWDQLRLHDDFKDRQLGVNLHYILSSRTPTAKPCLKGRKDCESPCDFHFPESLCCLALTWSLSLPSSTLASGSEQSRAPDPGADSAPTKISHLGS